MESILSVKADIKKVGKRIYDFLHPTVESLMNKVTIAENLSITQEEYEELLEILDEWEM